MDTLSTRALTQQLADDLGFLEQHARRADDAPAAARLRLAAARIAFFRSFSAALSRAFPLSPIRAIASAASHVVPVVTKINGSPARLLDA